MSVVLRCPNCGTTRTTAGECEACHEAAVRYFCTNHTPGLWLDQRTCPKCNEQRVRPPARVPVPARSVSALPPRAVSAAPAAPRPPAPMDPVRAEEPDAEGPALQPWQRLLSAVLKARRTAIAARASHGPTVGIGGCLRRLLVILVLLIISIAAAFFVFGRALLNAVQPY